MVLASIGKPPAPHHQVRWSLVTQTRLPRASPAESHAEEPHCPLTSLPLFCLFLKTNFLLEQMQIYRKAVKTKQGVAIYS